MNYKTFRRKYRHSYIGLRNVFFWICLFRQEKKEKKESEVAQSCPTLCDPTDCSLPGSSVHGISQARILGWVAISFSGRSSQPRDWIQVSRIVGRRFTIWATREEKQKQK